MAKQKAIRVKAQDYQIPIHEDVSGDENGASEMDETENEAESPLSRGASSSDEDAESSEEELEQSVAEDMARFEDTFKGISDRYRLINRIGEGTFSTVYKAEDLHYHNYNNDWDVEDKQNSPWRHSRKGSRGSRQSNAPRYVAIKKIYVTSSPMRIFNELELLHDLRHSDSVCPLITAFRHQDQVIAVLPYFQHQDFRDYFRNMTVSCMRLYFRSLFTGLQAVHARGILHRDIKPTNFLYNPTQNRGVLVDFGLAERQGTDWHACNCEVEPMQRRHRIDTSAHASGIYQSDTASYPKNDRDTRPSKRANRAGTRGFRAPEVLLKCTAQTTAIDVWSCGVILLTLLARRFPFFHSADDIDALLELTNIFGKKRMRETALIHGQVFETNIPTYNESGHSIEKIVLWSTSRNDKDASGRRISNLSADEKQAVDFVERCLDCDPTTRITAKEALNHPFVAAAGLGLDSDDPVDLL